VIERSESIDPMALELEDWPLEPDQIVDGDPQVSGRVLDASADGKVERGVWQHTAGVSRDTESDELFVVLTGRATIEVEGGPTLEVGPGEGRGVDRPQTLAQRQRAGEGLFHGDLLIEDEADQERHWIGRQQRVGLVGVGEVQTVGHRCIVLVRRSRGWNRGTLGGRLIGGRLRRGDIQHCLRTRHRADGIVGR